MPVSSFKRLAASLIAAGFAFATASAQITPPFDHLQPEPAPADPGANQHIEIPINIPVIRNFHVTSLGRVLDDGSTYSPRTCNTISSFTDANFGGGNFTVEAGFSETEMFAATYTVAASNWPIKINLAEAIFATSNASQATTTHWSILFYQGNPQTGVNVFQEMADDVILPYIRVGPGTAGVNVQFSIDTQDPDQLIIEDNGTHQFSVAWRIDHHNAQSGNPCFTAPPTCCNAFPCVDTSGLSSGTNNWLYGVNCGSLGCPANGGWSRFSNLASFCRPTGDVVTRVTWSSLSCVPGTGACCSPDGSCEVVSEETCANRNGLYRGEFSSCSNANCPAPTGACCFSNGNCLVLTPAQCASAAGSYLGNDTVCGTGGICPLGACCLPNGSCAGSMSQGACTAAGGSFRGVGTTCSTSTCPTGRCCLPIGSCSIMTQIQCTSQGGTWGGAGTNCVNANCPQPTGACCVNNGCIVLTAVDCSRIPNSSWAGAFTTCIDSDGNGIADACDTTIPCPADFNGDGGVDGQDVEAFFTAWSSGDQSGDVNFDGGVDGQDVEYFFDRWSAGGC